MATKRIAISNDGKQWEAAAVLDAEPPGQYSYRAVIQTAQAMLVGRRILSVVGPFGPGVEVLPNDTVAGRGAGVVDLLDGRGHADHPGSRLYLDPRPAHRRRRLNPDGRRLGQGDRGAKDLLQRWRDRLSGVG